MSLSYSELKDCLASFYPRNLNFIETGTYKAGTVLITSGIENISEVYSIEIHEPLYEH